MWFRHPAGLIISDSFFIAHGGDIETIRTGHRYSWAPPAIHVKNGEQIGPVQWYDPSHAIVEMPHVGQLPELPTAWIADTVRAPAVPTRDRENTEINMEVPTAFAVLVKEVSELVREAMADWTMTARLCVIIIVITVTTCITGLLLG
jgi:hypothetical protein